MCHHLNGKRGGGVLSVIINENTPKFTGITFLRTAAIESFYFLYGKLPKNCSKGEIYCSSVVNINMMSTLYMDIILLFNIDTHIRTSQAILSRVVLSI